MIIKNAIFKIGIALIIDGVVYSDNIKWTSSDKRIINDKELYFHDELHYNLYKHIRDRSWPIDYHQFPKFNIYYNKTDNIVIINVWNFSAQDKTLIIDEFDLYGVNIEWNINS